MNKNYLLIFIFQFTIYKSHAKSVKYALITTYYTN